LSNLIAAAGIVQSGLAGFMQAPINQADLAKLPEMPDLKAEQLPRIRCHMILISGYITPSGLVSGIPRWPNPTANQSQGIPMIVQFP
jgi:hypothetical protein